MQGNLNEVVGMGGRNIVALLLSEAKRRPEVAALVERAAHLTDEEIEAANVPLPWYRKALTELRKITGQGNARTSAEAYVVQMGDIVETPPPLGSILRYDGPDIDLEYNTRAMSVPLRTGELMFRTDREIWLGSLSLGNALPQPFSVLSSNVERKAYFAALEKEAPAAPDTASPSGDRPLFRITRHT